MIDAGQSRPPDVDPEAWNTLCARRKSPKSKITFEQMRIVSLAKGTKESQMRAIEKTMIGELVRIITSK